MNREEAKSLRVRCDKNTIWPKLELVVKLWGDCIDDHVISQEQIVSFKEFLLGALIVEHDKGRIIKLYKDVDEHNVVETYTLLRRAMDLSGIGPRYIIGSVKRVTIYPNGSLKVEYSGGKIDWL